MTIKEATEKLVTSEEFKAAAKQLSNAKLRVYLGRYKKGTLSECGALELLLQFGYTVEVKKVKK